MTDWSKCPAVESVPGRVSGAWVFKGTRLPVYALFEQPCGGRDDLRFHGMVRRGGGIRGEGGAGARGAGTPGQGRRMRILFDKGTPRQLHRRLFGHEVETVQERGWDTLSNGDLLDRAEEAGFEVADDHRPEHPIPANMSNRRMAVVVLMNTAWPRIARRTEAVAPSAGRDTARRGARNPHPDERRGIA